MRGRSKTDASYINGSPLCLSDLGLEINSNKDLQKNLNRISFSPESNKGVKRLNSSPSKCMMVDNTIYSPVSSVPPPLPPRVPLTFPRSNTDPDAVNSINKQMSYPLVATCATLVNNYVSNSIF